jgi:hypothetical protein
VRTIRKATEEEVLRCFWEGELAPVSRWTDAEVAERQRQWRGRSGLFQGFPEDVEWQRATLTRDEVLAILYIDWDWWLRVSNGTRLATVAATVQGRDDGDRAIAAAVEANQPLIVVGDRGCTKLVLLEGHVRLTAYAAFPEYLPAELEVYLGTSPTMADWWAF